MDEIVLGYTNIFVDAAIDCFEETIKLDSQIQEEKIRRESSKAKYDDFEKCFLLGRLVNLKYKKLFSTIVFSSFALESYINGYGILRLGEYYYKHLERIEVREKWLLFPKLVCCKHLDKSKEGWCLLKRLIDSRNWLAHDKPTKKLLYDSEGIKKSHEIIRKGIKLSAYDSVRVLTVLNNELLSLDPDVENYPLIYDYNLKRFHNLCGNNK